MQEFSPEWFDESSKAWRANKKRSGQSWKYLCSEPLCKRVSFGFESLASGCGGAGDRLCRMHRNHTSSRSLQMPSPELLPLPSPELLHPKADLPLSSKPSSSRETLTSVRTSPRLHSRVSQAAQPGQGAVRTSGRRLRATPSQ